MGKVQHKKEGKIYVLCLEKPFGINVPQTFENDGVYYDEVYKTDVNPRQTQIDEDGKKTRKWFWVY